MRPLPRSLVAQRYATTVIDLMMASNTFETEWQGLPHILAGPNSKAWVMRHMS